MEDLQTREEALEVLVQPVPTASRPAARDALMAFLENLYREMGESIDR